MRPQAFTTAAFSRTYSLSGFQPVRVQRIAGEAQILDDPAANHVLLDDPLGSLGGDGPIPRAFGIHDADGAAGADAEAADPRAVRRAVRARNVQLLHPALDV